MSKSLLLCRVPGKSATFTRCVRDESDNVVKTLQFVPGAPVLVEGDDLLAVMRDIGKTIFIVELDEKIKGRLNVMYAETSAFMKAELGVDVDFPQSLKGHIKQVAETAEPGVDIELDNDILDALEQNLEALGGEVSPESIAEYAKGNELTDLKGIGESRAAAIVSALGL